MENVNHNNQSQNSKQLETLLQLAHHVGGEKLIQALIAGGANNSQANNLEKVTAALLAQLQGGSGSDSFGSQSAGQSAMSTSHHHNYHHQHHQSPQQTAMSSVPTNEDHQHIQEAATKYLVQTLQKSASSSQQPVAQALRQMLGFQGNVQHDQSHNLHQDSMPQQHPINNSESSSQDLLRPVLQVFASLSQAAGNSSSSSQSSSGTHSASSTPPPHGQYHGLSSTTTGREHSSPLVLPSHLSDMVQNGFGQLQHRQQQGFRNQFDEGNDGRLDRKSTLVHHLSDHHRRDSGLAKMIGHGANSHLLNHPHVDFPSDQVPQALYKQKRHTSIPTAIDTSIPRLSNRQSSSSSDRSQQQQSNANSVNSADGPRRWLPEEDDRLREAVAKYGDRRWKEIAADVGTRDNVQCLQRWRKSLKPGLIKGPWSEGEDKLLRAKVREKREDSMRTWSWVAKHIPGRNAKQCRERWQNFLDDTIKRGGWSPEEDDRLAQLHNDLQGRWAMIAREMPGRTENSVKVRFQSISRMKIREANRGSHVPGGLSQDESPGPTSPGHGSSENSNAQNMGLNTQNNNRGTSSAASTGMGTSVAAKILDRKGRSESTISPSSSFALDSSSEKSPSMHPASEKIKRKSESTGSLEKKRRTNSHPQTQHYTPVFSSEQKSSYVPHSMPFPYRPTGPSMNSQIASTAASVSHSSSGRVTHVPGFNGAGASGGYSSSSAQQGTGHLGLPHPPNMIDRSTSSASTSSSASPSSPLQTVLPLMNVQRSNSYSPFDPARLHHHTQQQQQEQQNSELSQRQELLRHFRLCNPDN